MTGSLLRLCYPLFDWCLAIRCLTGADGGARQVACNVIATVVLTVGNGQLLWLGDVVDYLIVFILYDYDLVVTARLYS